MNRGKLAFIVLIAAAALTFTSCEALLKALMGGVTIEEQINAFETTLNSADRGGIRSHFHPDMTGYDQIADDAVFDTGPLSYANAGFLIGEPNPIIADVATCTYSDGNGATGEIVFYMEQYELDYMIMKIELTVASVTYVLERFTSE
jgi:hypothetical protein